MMSVLQKGTVDTPPVLASASSPSSFPTWDSEGPPVDASKCVEPNTGLATGIGWVLLILFLLVAIATIYLFIILAIGALVDWLRNRRALALLKGSAIEVTPEQFPEIYRCAATLAVRLGMKQVPAIYLVEGNIINAAAMRMAGRQVVVLMDDVVDACLRSGDVRTLSFIIGHELAHHALGHTGYFRAQISRVLRWLSRLDEFTCDRVAGALVGDRTVSANALTVLLAGPHLIRFVNAGQLRLQAAQVVADRTSKKVERQLTHPLLLRRLHRFLV